MCCARMLIVAKSNGDPRRIVNFKVLNDVCERQTHHTPLPFQVSCAVLPNRLMMTTDAWNGYHSVALHKDDRHYFTFIMEFGCYRYKFLTKVGEKACVFTLGAKNLILVTDHKPLLGY